MYLVFMGFCIVCEVIIYFYVPETQGIPVEEMGALFGDEVALHMTADGRGIVEKPGAARVEQLELADADSQE
jgi:hypothetical protein